MALRQRLGVMGLLAFAALAIYGMGRYYSPTLMAYVVEQTLAEKSPPGTDPAMLRSRFEALISASPSREAKLETLLRLSQYLEKVQELTRPELEMLLHESRRGPASGLWKIPGTFFLLTMSNLSGLMPRSSAEKRVRVQHMYPDEIAFEYKSETIATEKPAELVCTEARLSFEELFERYRALVFQLAYRMLGDREEALDVSQEVFLTIYRKLHHFRGDSSLKTWIYRIVINRAANRCRWWNRLRRRGTVSLDEHLSTECSRSVAETLESQGRSPEQSLLVEEERAEIERSLLSLPVQQRGAVIMRDIEGLSYEEIAEAMDVSLGTVKSRIARGREELKRRLNGVLG